jgi:hypothetical protein
MQIQSAAAGTWWEMSAATGHLETNSSPYRLESVTLQTQAWMRNNSWAHSCAQQCITRQTRSSFIRARSNAETRIRPSKSAEYHLVKCLCSFAVSNERQTAHAVRVHVFDGGLFSHTEEWMLWLIQQVSKRRYDCECSLLLYPFASCGIRPAIADSAWRTHICMQHAQHRAHTAGGVRVWVAPSAADLVCLIACL